MVTTEREPLFHPKLLPNTSGQGTGGDRASRASEAAASKPQEVTKAIIALAEDGVYFEPTWFHTLRNIVNGGINAFKILFQTENPWGMDGPFTPEGKDLHFHPTAVVMDTTNMPKDSPEMYALCEIMERITDKFGCPFIITSLEEGEDSNGNIIPASTILKTGLEQRYTRDMEDEMAHAFLKDRTIKQLTGLLPEGVSIDDPEVRGNIIEESIRARTCLNLLIKAVNSQGFKTLKKRYTKEEWSGHSNQSVITPPLPEAFKLRCEYIDNYILERTDGEFGYMFAIDPPSSNSKDTMQRYIDALMSGPDMKHGRSLDTLESHLDTTEERVQLRHGDRRTNQSKIRMYGMRRRVNPSNIETPVMRTNREAEEGDA